MTIENKDWYAQDDKMPGVNTLRVSGIVTVPDYTAVPVLTKSSRPTAFNHLSLDLRIERHGIGAQVVNDQKVVYTQPSGADVASVSIYYNGELLTDINNVIITH